MSSRINTRAIAIAAVAVIAVAVGALSYVALNRDYSSAVPAYSVPTPTATQTPENAAPAYTGYRFLVAGDDTHAWRAASGRCSTDTAFVESTSDGGATWTAVAVSRDDRPTSILGLASSAAAEVTVISQTAAECAPTAFTTQDAGAGWSEATEPTGIWYVRPSDYRVVNAAGTAVDAPCQGRVYARNATEAILNCSGGVAFRTTDGGTTWDDGGSLPGVASVASGGDGYVVAIRSQGDCQGIQFRTVGVVAGANDGRILGCSPIAVGTGAISIALSPGGIWVWAENRVEHVTDSWAQNLGAQA